MRFAERIGAVLPREIQIDSMDETLRNCLCNYYKELYKLMYSDTDDMVHFVLDKIGIVIEGSYADDLKIEKILQLSKEWYTPYEILEYVIQYILTTDLECFLYTERTQLLRKLNTILEEEKSGYRMIEGEFVKITDEMELTEIQEALHTPFTSVDTHIKKALTLYSDRNHPDYENSIKESISAVEAMCCIILQDNRPTLGAALKKLIEKGVVIHEAMEKGFNKLYGFASDQNGIRHAGIDFTNAPEEDARYMLVTCSAFVNYLKDKCSKAQSGGTT